MSSVRTPLTPLVYQCMFFQRMRRRGSFGCALLEDIETVSFWPRHLHCVPCTSKLAEGQSKPMKEKRILEKESVPTIDVAVYSKTASESSARDRRKSKNVSPFIVFLLVYMCFDGTTQPKCAKNVMRILFSCIIFLWSIFCPFCCLKCVVNHERFKVRENREKQAVKLLKNCLHLETLLTTGNLIENYLNL